MKKALLITLALYLANSHFLVAQSWFKTFPLVQQTPVKIVQLSSGDFLLLATPTNWNNSFKPIYLKKLSKTNGSVIWQTTLHEQPIDASYSTILSGASQSTPDIYPTNDGGFVLSMLSIDPELNDTIINDSTYRAADRFTIMKFGSNGNLNWKKSYKKGFYTRANAVKQLSNDAIVAVGGYSPNGSSSNAIFNIINPNDGSDIVYQEYPNAMFTSLDNNCCYFYCSNSVSRGVYKLNLYGDTIWTRKPFGNFNSTGRLNCMATFDGGCIVNRGDSILKIDSSGTLIWKKKGKGNGVTQFANGLNEQYLATWTGVNPLLLPQGSKRQIFLNILDNNCDSIAAFYYPDSATLNTLGIYGIHATDNSLVATGLYRGNLCVLKTDPSGNLLSPIDSVFSTPNFATLNSNNISASFKSNGNLLQNGEVSFYPFQAPIGSGKSPIFANGLTLGGIDAFNQLHLAAQSYNNGMDYWSGPLNYYDFNTTDNWNKVWLVSMQQIETHILDFLDNGVVDNPIPAIFDYPGFMNTYAKGNNNTSLIVSEPMAPFKDLNQNGIYEPNYGEYPDIKGDQMLWFVFNDGHQRHSQSLGVPLDVQIKGCAYDYNCSNNSSLFNTVFVEYDIQNKSLDNYHDFYFGQWVDYDLGNFSNDRVGCDTSSNSFYVYNGTVPDVNIAGVNGYGTQTVVQTTAFLNRKLSGHVSWGNAANAGMNDPVNATQYYNYLTGRWADSTLMTYDSTGYGGTTPYPYAFDGNPANVAQWSECSASLQSGDRRSMGVSGPYNFQKDSTLKFSLAYTYHGDSLPNYPCFDYSTIQQTLNGIRNGFNQNSFTACSATLPTIPDSMIIHTGISAISNSTVSIYPNPANTTLYISAEGITIQTISVYNMSGQKLIEQPFNRQIDISSFVSDVYLIELKTEKGINRKRFIKI